MVHAERTPKSKAHGHSHTVESGVIFYVSISRRCRPARGRLDASSQRQSRSQLCAVQRSIQHHSEALESRTTLRVSFYNSPRRSDVNSLLQTLHWLPVEQRINYKLAVLTFKTQQTSSPQYLSHHISLRTSARSTRSSSVPLLCVPFRRTDIICQTIVQHCRTSD